jgi:hypothetical protein
MDGPKKKTSKRKRTKYPGLNKNCYSRIKQEFFDLDYVDKLSEEEKQWMNDFMNGHLGANTKDTPIFPNYEDKQKCWKMNNDRNIDTYSIKRVTGELSDVATMPEEKTEYIDELIAYIDEQIELEKI